MSLSDPHYSRDVFAAAYRDTPPWDIGAPQPDLMALLSDYPASGPVLDVGCGTGELSLALARRGLTVLGVDIAEAAIQQAQSKAVGEPGISPLVEFRVGDALHPSQFPGPFGAVVDSGFYHLFDAPERESFARELAVALTPGGRYYLVGFALSAPFPHGPKEVREDELWTRFAPERGWRVVTLRSAQIMSRLSSDGIPAIAACLERTSV